MTTPLTLRVCSVFGVLALTMAAQAGPVPGCNAASKTNVDCAEIFNATVTETGINFFTETDYHVGYRRGVTDFPAFMNTPMSAARHDAYATSVNDLSAAVRGSGSTLVVEFDAERALSGIVLSGLGEVRRDPASPETIDPAQLTETAQVVAYDANGEKVFDAVVEGERGYVYVNFGDVVPHISTLLIASGGGLPGLTSTNTNVSYLITPITEPGSLWLVITGLAVLALRRRLG